MDNVNEVTVQCFFGTACYVSSYCDEICNAELIRNCCVNLGLDPDMEAGRLLNYDVLRRKVTKEGVLKLSHWAYNPSARIKSVVHDNGGGPFMLQIFLKSKS